VWGRDRDVAINRALRALGELKIEGIATTIPADIAILEHADFRANHHSTKWVEEVLDLSGVSATATTTVEVEEPKVKREVDVEANGKRFSVAMWVPEAAAAAPAASGGRRRSAGSSSSGGASGSGDVTVPMQGTIVKVNVTVGDTVEIGDAIVVLEAMKMENNVTAEKAGTVTEIRVAEGDSVGGGDVVAIIG